jgi:hypothetical protein
MKRRDLVLFGLACTVLGCTGEVASERWYEKGQTPASDWERAGLGFVQQLVARRFADAHRMLAQEAQQRLTERDLEKRTLQLISEEFAPMEEPWVLMSMSRWPDKRWNDQGMTYVQIGGDGNEAIMVTVTLEAEQLRIREIEWGRP